MKKKLAIFCLAAICLILFIITFSGCNPLSKQIKTFNSFADAHPEYLAPKCVEHFPVKDSVGKVIIDSTHKAVNVNLTDSLKDIKETADALQKNLIKTIAENNQCSSLALFYQSQVKTLTDKINSLNNNYKPCKPDIIYMSTPVYRKDVAELNVWMNKFKVKQDSLLIVKTQNVKNEETAASRLHIIIVMGIILLIVGLAFLAKLFGKI